MLAPKFNVSPMLVTKNKHHFYKRIGGLAVLVNADSAFADDGFKELVSIMIKSSEESGKISYGINFCPNHGPSATQRAYIKQFESKLVDGTFKRMSLITNSMIVRGGITALRWFMKSIGDAPIIAYPVRQTEEAVKWTVAGTQYDADAVFSALKECTEAAGYKSL